MEAQLVVEGLGVRAPAVTVVGEVGAEVHLSQPGSLKDRSKVVQWQLVQVVAGSSDKRCSS